MRIRRLRIFTLIFVIAVLIAAYGLALLRTYIFKPAPGSSGESKTFAFVESVAAISRRS
ncbi:MAG: hypothetical protein LDL33_05195 [Desulfomonile sp.]|nr:hypothetical protein [Desulfomonile sp.]